MYIYILICIEFTDQPKIIRDGCDHEIWSWLCARFVLDPLANSCLSRLMCQTVWYQFNMAIFNGQSIGYGCPIILRQIHLWGSRKSWLSECIHHQLPAASFQTTWSTPTFLRECCLSASYNMAEKNVVRYLYGIGSIFVLSPTQHWKTLVDIDHRSPRIPPSIAICHPYQKYLYRHIPFHIEIYSDSCHLEDILSSILDIFG